MGTLGQHYLKTNLRRVMDLVCEGLESGEIGSFRIVRYVKPPEVKVKLDDFTTYLKPEERRVYKHVDYPFNEGGAVVFRDKYGDEPTEYTLDLASIEKGIDVFAEKCKYQFAQWVVENDDACTGDCFIQCCLLGDVVYG